MKECLVIGRANVGKTLFVLNFAEFLGRNEIDLVIRFPNGFSTAKRYTIDRARRELTGLGPHKTRCLQSVQLDIPYGKGRKRVQLTDTTGLIDTIHQDVEVRRAIAQTLNAIRQVDLLLHLIDPRGIDRAGARAALGEVDYQVAQFAQLRGRYCILANKMDLPGAREGLQRLMRELPGQYIIPISALYKRGFKEVKTFVSRHS
ncbi:MAG: GTPase [bacterium]|nr:50S ribosome-binding GTPase [Bacillota bacterium]